MDIWLILGMLADASIGQAVLDRLAQLDLRSRWALAMLFALYVPASLAMLPVWPLTISAGFLFGMAAGVPTALAGLTLGASAGFLASRYLLRGPLVRRTADRPLFAALDHAVKQHGLSIVVLTRLSPLVPYNLLNYLYGLTGLSMRSFVVGSTVGMLPGTLLYVYLGTQAQSLLDIWQGRVAAGTTGLWLLGVGVVATLLATVLIGVAARRALESQLPPRNSDHASAP